MVLVPGKDYSLLFEFLSRYILRIPGHLTICVVKCPGLPSHFQPPHYANPSKRASLLVKISTIPSCVWLIFDLLRWLTFLTYLEYRGTYLSEDKFCEPETQRDLNFDILVKIFDNKICYRQQIKHNIYTYATTNALTFILIFIIS